MQKNVDLALIESRAEHSAAMIQQYDLKNRRKFPYVPTRVIDDFFETPSAVRSFALQQEFHKSIDSTFPGERTTYLNILDDHLFTVFAKKLLDNLPGINGFSKLTATFHSIDETYGNGWVHDDEPKYNVVGVVYLNPNPPPNSGTILYKDQFDPKAGEFLEYFKKDVLFANKEERKQLVEIRNKQRSMFTPTTIVENVFNRCVIYDPRTWHSPDHFFGKNREDARLTLVFFAEL